MEKERLRILLVDPDFNDHPLVRDSLERSGISLKLDTVTETHSAIDLIEKEPYDFILSDHAPPDVSAFRLLRFLNEKRLGIPVLLLTRDGQIQTVREAFKLGAGDYLLKEELEAVSLVDVISSVLERNRSRQESHERNRCLEERANRDGLTGLHNHRFFLETLEKELMRTRRYTHPLSLIMLDLDGFKAINDTCGHQKGDHVLQRVATLLRESVRDCDTVARYGGDEFVILLPETDKGSALKIAQRILLEIRRNPFLDGNRIFPLSASVGISSYHSLTHRPGELLREADRALYSAKKRGRDRIITSKADLQTGQDGVPLTQLVLDKLLS